MLRTSSPKPKNSKEQMSPHSPQKQLCNGGYQSSWEEEEEDQSKLLSRGKLSLFDKLSLSHQVWLQLGVEPEQVREILRRQPPGAFLVWSNNCGRNKILTVRTERGACETEDFIIKENCSVYYLEHSYLGFTSIFQLIGYYCVSRDVLPSRLQLPLAILCATYKEELDEISALGMMFWDLPLNQKQDGSSQEAAGDTMEVNPATSTAELLKHQHLPMCSIQVTGENGALFFINPLFLKEHGDSWLQQAGPSCTFQHSRLATRCRKRSAGSLAPQSHRDTLSRNDSEKSDSGKSVEEEEIFKAQSAEVIAEVSIEASPETPSTASRRKTFSRRAAWSWGDNPEGEVTEEVASPRGGGGGSSTLPPYYRASWLESSSLKCPSSLRKSHSESSLLACDSPVLPPISELDSLSVSSMEEEVTAASPHTPHRQRYKRHPHGLTDKVRNRLSAVSHAFTGLVSADRRIRNKIEELSHNKDCYFGSLLQGFVSYTIEGRGKHTSSTEMLQGIQQMITSLRNYLTQSSELTHLLDQSDHEECDTEVAIQKALQKCVLKPLRDNIYACLLDFHTKDGSLKKLTTNQLILQSQTLAQLEVTASVPDAVALEKIQQKFAAMHLAYSPFKKVAQLLKACKLIYEAMSGSSGKPYGADDFLPVLTYVLATSNLTNLWLDVEYMMELLDQNQLQGEGGYYLTTMFGALFHISNFQSRSLTRQISDEAKSSLYQWRRRRTLHHNQSKRRSAQDLLSISLQEPGGNQVTILAPAHMTVTEVCKACAEKFGVSEPEVYGLFLVRGSSYKRLEEGACPQQVKQEMHQKEGTAFIFVYAPADGTPCSQHEEQLTLL
ncbi:ras and Rab interactor 3 [Mobula birostris]|uniref:ras and Rab interactor 3 n=1 Tax=Mobula birostris TaxID=1983395 RepID=UPI003B287094